MQPPTARLQAWSRDRRNRHTNLGFSIPPFWIFLLFLFSLVQEAFLEIPPSALHWIGRYHYRCASAFFHFLGLGFLSYG